MDINEIIPYARNARHNKKAIPAVADSIRQFGLITSLRNEQDYRQKLRSGRTRERLEESNENAEGKLISKLAELEPVKKKKSEKLLTNSATSIEK